MSRLRGEDGFSLVPAIAMLALLIMLGGVAVQEAISALGATRKNELRKRALQTADAAVDSAVYALNRADLSGGINIDPLDPGSVLNQTCLVGFGTAGGLDLTNLPTGTIPDSDGRRWCPETTPETTPEGTTWTFRVSELARVGAEDCAGTGLLSLDREIVAVAEAGTEAENKTVRRIRARLRASIALLSGAAVQSASTTAALQMSGSARVLGDIASNHDITGAGTNVVTGSAVVPQGRTVSGVVPGGGALTACSKFVLPAVDPGDSATVNDNAALSADCVTAGMITTPCKPLIVTTGGVTNTTIDKPTLRVWGNGRAVLSGATYSYCSIRLESQGSLVIKSTTPITRIFLRDPADCAGVPNAGQIVVDGSSRIINCHNSTQPETLQLYALGSETTATTQTLAGAGLLTSSTATLAACGTVPSLNGWPMVVYAPNSRVEIGGSTELAGQVAADTVYMSGGAAVQPVNALVNLDQLGAEPILPLYQAHDYVECVGKDFDELPPEDPSQGC